MVRDDDIGYRLHALYRELNRRRLQVEARKLVETTFDAQLAFGPLEEALRRLPDPCSRTARPNSFVDRLRPR